MDFLSNLILGIVQGLTEFLPVSSSGHLVLSQALLGEAVHPGPALEIALHLGTLVAIIVFYRKDVWDLVLGTLSFFKPSLADKKDRDLVIKIVLATGATGYIGIMYRDIFEGLFESPTAVGVALFFTAALLFLSKRWGQSDSDGKSFSKRDAFVLGIAQGLAIVPGISRSGMTIAVALGLGAKREDAARLSFLIAIPATLGAGVLEGKDGLPPDFDFVNVGAGVLAAALVGYGALIWLNAWLKQGRLYLFAYYLVLAGAAAILLSL